MSKSDISDYSRINLTDSGETIQIKIKKAKTDSEPTIGYNPSKSPEMANLIEIYSTLSNKSIEEVVKQFRDSSTVTFKKKMN